MNREECYAANHEGRATWWEYDARGIELGKVCEECVAELLARYRPEILSGYGQSDVDEPIEPEDRWDDGITLPEVLVVLVALATLAAILIPALGRMEGW